MENKKIDRRVLRTRRALHAALMVLILEKRYDKITVQNIIDKADVGRSTFYAHFRDKEDLLVKGLVQFSEDLQSEIEVAEYEGEESEQIIHSLIFFQHAYLHHDMYGAMYDGGGAEVILETGRRHINQDVENRLAALFPEGSELNIPKPVISSFLAGAMLSVLNWWLDAGQPYPPERINEMFQQLAMSGVESLMLASENGI